ncbi:uncharacterized protein EI90DRAFT_3068978, partial [Cantharellus anzutake]|uniref:uncharacterized protein n=1 Tax=Cantharellus anzutake TaxID=1750568 RepID=UPI00190538EB
MRPTLLRLPYAPFIYLSNSEYTSSAKRKLRRSAPARLEHQYHGCPGAGPHARGIIASIGELRSHYLWLCVSALSLSL